LRDGNIPEEGHKEVRAPDRADKGIQSPSRGRGKDQSAKDSRQNRGHEETRWQKWEVTHLKSSEPYLGKMSSREPRAAQEVKGTR